MPGGADQDAGAAVVESEETHGLLADEKNQEDQGAPAGSAISAEELAKASAKNGLDDVSVSTDADELQAALKTAKAAGIPRDDPLYKQISVRQDRLRSIVKELEKAMKVTTKVKHFQAPKVREMHATLLASPLIPAFSCPRSWMHPLPRSWWAIFPRSMVRPFAMAPCRQLTCTLLR